MIARGVEAREGGRLREFFAVATNGRGPWCKLKIKKKKTKQKTEAQRSALVVVSSCGGHTLKPGAHTEPDIRIKVNYTDSK